MPRLKIKVQRSPLSCRPALTSWPPIWTRSNWIIHHLLFMNCIYSIAYNMAKGRFFSQNNYVFLTWEEGHNRDFSLPWSENKFLKVPNSHCSLQNRSIKWSIFDNKTKRITVNNLKLTKFLEVSICRSFCHNFLPIALKNKKSAVMDGPRLINKLKLVGWKGKFKLRGIISNNHKITF